MTIVTPLPEPVDVVENAWIPMPDGARLAAKIWRPATCHDVPVPAILEYIPYRKRFGTAARDAVTHGYLAGHGYACVRVDLRGSGESDGVLTDEYRQQELDDGCAVIGWLAAQPWCSGRVGMIGISWGGFNALQIAALQPPALKAIVTLCSTDDRYADDIHHMGGCLLGDSLSWASTMFAYNSLPPDPVLVGARWRDMWRERLEGSGLWLSQWLKHQRRDAYWRHGSICEDFAAVRCPVYAVSGWADGYSNAVFRLLANLPGPAKGLIGPWSHKYPHFGEPGPAINFLDEVLRWWDHWLKDLPTGIMAEPALKVWMQDSVPPTTSYPERPGRWVAEERWPTARIEPRILVLTRHHLVPPADARPAKPVTVQSPLTLGLFAGKWCSYAAGPDLAHDQRQEDGGALVYDTEMLDQDCEILGAVSVALSLSVDRPVAQVVARLSDIRPDGKATRVTYGLLNLTHRNGSADPTPMAPGQRVSVTVQLNDIAHRFPKGHRIRLALSTSYWPLAWPPPEPVTLTLFPEACRVVLPVRPPRAEDAVIAPFGAPRGAAPPARETLEPGRHNWLVHRDLAKDDSTLEVINEAGRYRLADIDLEVTTRAREWYTAVADRFETVRGETWWERGLAREDWRIRTITRTVLSSSPSHFTVTAALDAYEGDKRVYSQNWDERIPRDLV